jgi:hypothetical protein
VEKGELALQLQIVIKSLSSVNHDVSLYAMKYAELQNESTVQSTSAVFESSSLSATEKEVASVQRENDSLRAIIKSINDEL